MARFRLALPAKVDLANILAASARQWGIQGRRRYASTVAAALRKIANDPEGPLTRARNELLPGIRSFHIRHARADSPETKVRKPVHVLYYRVIKHGLIEIVRVLHDRMEPSSHFEAVAEEVEQ